MDVFIACIPLFLGWTLDLLVGDPAWFPHPVVWFGKEIAWCEGRFNKGAYRRLKGAVCAVGLIASTYILAAWVLSAIGNVWLNAIVQAILIFYCLAGTTLANEVRQVFIAVDESLEKGRERVARIVGRDTSNLSSQEIRTAALETLAENLSDGVIAPLFWYALLGVPGMLAYKMVNTLDSMIGYRNERYRDFGYAAAKIDDIANFIPARITAFLMVITAGKPNLLKFVRANGSRHLSPNSGYPEAALSGILDCRFGGPHNYFGKTVYKPYIGEHSRAFVSSDMLRGIAINRRTEVVAVVIVLLVKALI